MDCILRILGFTKKPNKTPPVVMYDDKEYNNENHNAEQEVEIFRLNKFDPTKNYAFALYKKQIGTWPDEHYYTTKGELQYLGKWIKQERWGYGDGGGGAEYFDDNGKETRIVYDYAGTTCFVEV